MSDLPLIVNWKGLRKLGWPYSRAQTWRMMFDPDYADNRFPACRKLGKHRNAHPVWRVLDVLAYFEAHGLKVAGDWNSREIGFRPRVLAMRGLPSCADRSEFA